MKLNQKYIICTYLKLGMSKFDLFIMLYLDF